MRNRPLTPTAGRSALVFWLILALLLAQGIRMCLHAHDAPAHEHASTVHLESTLSVVADHEESVFDADVSLAMLSKVFSTPVFALVLAFVFFVPILRQLVRYRPPAKFWFPVSATYSLTPPLRAPPR